MGKLTPYFLPFALQAKPAREYPGQDEAYEGKDADQLDPTCAVDRDDQIGGAQRVNRDVARSVQSNRLSTDYNL